MKLTFDEKFINVVLKEYLLSDKELEENIARASDILEQINKLNVMVDFHKNESKERSMVRQYEEMRSNYLKELQQILSEFKVNVKIEV